MSLDHTLQGDPDALLLLASASAGRRRTLERAGILHAALATDLEEDALLAAHPDLQPADQVLLLARAKAEAAVAATAEDGGGYVVLGCDSMLQLDGEVVGKPHLPETARDRWRRMRGREGVLHSGHWLVDDRDPEDGGTGATFGATASTIVRFAALTDEEIDAYVDTGEPLEVAGAFTIDGFGGPFISGIDGDPHAVVGLSLPLLRELLAQIEVPLPLLWRRY
ncbi:septum formation inhibitor Maf [Brachybacterium sp. EF45031]|uniref:Maf family nucleotide pyrophosphatase n=1 Tax=Brachybacterium sillae TaxID=2810536 RepID=UPI00217D2553|nr:Maf family nucleotide pyrophosphatase [Brachybacterium sillae]MCS6711057.1 septum formation inhibitor Maf [Brachybacterium sillae]